MKYIKKGGWIFGLYGKQTVSIWTEGQDPEVDTALEAHTISSPRQFSGFVNAWLKEQS